MSTRQLRSCFVILCLASPAYRQGERTMSWRPAEPVAKGVWSHYAEPYAAWNRMREQYGDAPVTRQLETPQLKDE